MTPLPRIRRRRTEEEPVDEDPAVEEPADDAISPSPDEQVTQVAGALSVAPPPAAAGVTTPLDHTSIAQAAAAVQATAEIGAVPEAPPAPPAEEPPVPEDEPAPEPEPEPEPSAADADEPARASGLRRFGLWATGRSVAGVEPEPEAEAPGPDEATDAQPDATPEIAGAPATPARGPSAKDRGRLRRRIRYLRRARELGLRDLGGLMFDQYRFNSPNQELLAAKLAALHALDSERRALEHILGERLDFDDLREPGISACPSCGALHASDGRYCEVCGTRQTETA